MESIWNFFENLNEIVYAADMETHRIVYMNRKTLEIYGMTSLEEAVGGTCTGLFHDNRGYPCYLCETDELQPGQFKEWRYFDLTLGRLYEMKDTVLTEGGKRYHLHMRIALDGNGQDGNARRSLYDYRTIEHKLHAILLEAGTETDEEVAIGFILAQTGMLMESDRTYIFKNDLKGDAHNSYEWAAEGIEPWDSDLAGQVHWIERFRKGLATEKKPLIITHIEDIRESRALLYKIMKRKQVHSLAAFPIFSGEKLLGFFGFDNPRREFLEYGVDMIGIVTRFLESLIQKRDLKNKLKAMSFRDQLTGLGNRFAFEEALHTLSPRKSLGIVYCDITGLKRVNDTEGHQTGDKLICCAADAMRKVFSGDPLFRVGGDEMLVLVCGIDAVELKERERRLKKTARAAGCILASGSAWQDAGWGEGSLDSLQKRAEDLMYEDKASWYRTSGLDRRRRREREENV